MTLIFKKRQGLYKQTVYRAGCKSDILYNTSWSTKMAVICFISFSMGPKWKYLMIFLCTAKSNFYGRVVMIWLYYEFTCKFWMHWTPISSAGQFFILWCAPHSFLLLLSLVSLCKLGYCHNMVFIHDFSCFKP